MQLILVSSWITQSSYQPVVKKTRYSDIETLTSLRYTSTANDCPKFPDDFQVGKFAVLQVFLYFYLILPNFNRFLFMINCTRSGLHLLFCPAYFFCFWNELKLYFYLSIKITFLVILVYTLKLLLGTILSLIYKSVIFLVVNENIKSNFLETFRGKCTSLCIRTSSSIVWEKHW